MSLIGAIVVLVAHAAACSQEGSCWPIATECRARAQSVRTLLQGMVQLMELAERQLLQLLRGQEVAEFTLEILLRTERSDPGTASGSLVWTIAMRVAQVTSARTTNGTSFAKAWQRQRLWWRSAPRTTDTPARPGFGQAISPDRAERAELQFLSIVRGDAGGDFTITVTVKAGRWITRLQSPGTAGVGATGDGPSFAAAWYNDWPWWQDEQQDFGAPR
jgi:hypothetical protein